MSLFIVVIFAGYGDLRADYSKSREIGLITTFVPSQQGKTQNSRVRSDEKIRQGCLHFSLLLFVLHETLCVYSLRRYRREGTLKVLQQYVRAAIPVLILKRPIKNFSGYIMGGHPYATGAKKVKRSVIRRYEQKLKKIIKEFFEYTMS